MKLLAQVKLDVLKRMQTASGMAQLATAIHLVLGTEIRLHAKQLHIIPVAAEIM
jgi:monoamine oxidase